MRAPRTVETVRRPEAPERAGAAEATRKTRGSGLLGFPQGPPARAGVQGRGCAAHGRAPGPHPLCPAGTTRPPSEHRGRSQARGRWWGSGAPSPAHGLPPPGDVLTEPSRQLSPSVPTGGPAAEAHPAPGPPPGTTARSEGLWAFSGPVCAGVLEPTRGLAAWPSSQAGGPYFRPSVGFPLLFPKRKGMWTLCWLAPAVYSKTPKRALRAGGGSARAARPPPGS